MNVRRIGPQRCPRPGWRTARQCFEHRKSTCGSVRIATAYFVNYQLRRDHVEFRPLLGHPSSGLELKHGGSRIGTRTSSRVADNRRFDVDGFHPNTLLQRTCLCAVTCFITLRFRVLSCWLHRVLTYRAQCNKYQSTRDDPQFGGFREHCQLFLFDIIIRKGFALNRDSTIDISNVKLMRRSTIENRFFVRAVGPT